MKICKIAALVLAAAMIICCAVGCGEPKAFVSYRDTVIDQSQYCYLMSTYKAMYLGTYFGLSADNEEIWQQKMTDEITVGNYLSALALSNMMSTVVYVELFDEYGLTLTAEQINKVEAQINEFIAEAGSEKALENELSKFGTDIDSVRSALINATKTARLQEYLYGENGSEAASEQEIEEYYKKNYMRCKFILIHSKEEFVYDENGEAVYDADTQKYVTRELTEDEIAAKEQLAEELFERIEDGEDFEELLYTYTMDRGMHNFEDGYYINSASTFVEDAIKDAVAELEVGEIDFVETDSAWYIVKRYELIDGAWAQEKYANAMFGDLASTVNSAKMVDLVGQYADQIVVDTETVLSYPITVFTPNFKY